MTRPLLSVAAVLALALASPALRAQASSTLNKSEGPLMAAVTLEVFSDFQCPACKALHEGTLRQIEEKYVKTGRVRLVHKDFPLPAQVHPHARQAAEWAVAAAVLNQYPRVADALFQTQETWSKDGKIEDALKPVLGAPLLAQLKPLLKDARVKASIEADLAEGKQANVNSTPSLVVRSKGRTYPPVAGVVPADVLSQFLDRQLQ